MTWSRKCLIYLNIIQLIHPFTGNPVVMINSCPHIQSLICHRFPEICRLGRKSAGNRKSLILVLWSGFHHCWDETPSKIRQFNDVVISKIPGCALRISWLGTMRAFLFLPSTSHSWQRSHLWLSMGHMNIHHNHLWGLPFQWDPTWPHVFPTHAGRIGEENWKCVPFGVRSITTPFTPSIYKWSEVGAQLLKIRHV